MAGLYFHIPFCRKVCSYCNFHFSTNTRGMDELLDAMEMELEKEKNFLPNTVLETIYFGGGTPSLIPPARIDRFLKISHQLFSVNPQAEITLEANPEDITPDNLKAWKAAGINRLSIGIQSLVAADLEFMNRNHNASEARASIELALDAGFPSLNIDLIFGSPWLSDTEWTQNMEWAFHCGADHISAYALTVEPKTFLNKKISKGEWPNVEENRQSQHYRLLFDKALQEGWDFYEISNLSKPGHRAVHNSNYWKNLPYLGIGPSAHSFDGNSRRWNKADNKMYTELVFANQKTWEGETLSPKDHYNEYLLTNIRCKEGIEIEKLVGFNLKTEKEIVRELQNLHTKALILLTDHNASLTLEGRLLADWVTGELMV